MLATADSIYVLLSVSVPGYSMFPELPHIELSVRARHHATRMLLRVRRLLQQLSRSARRTFQTVSSWRLSCQVQLLL